MREHISNNINNLDIPIEEAKNKILSYLELDQTNLLILSDENILGGVSDPFHHKDLYPKAVRRIERMEKIFEGQSIKYVISIREYAQFYASIYCEFLRHAKRFITFRDFISKFNYMGYSWDALLTGISRRSDKSKLQIMVYEDILKKEEVFFEFFVKELNSDLVPHSDKNSRKSFRSKTIRFMETLDKEMDSSYIINFIGAIDNVVTKTGQLKRFDPWNQAEKEYFSEKYQKDIETLKSKDFQFI